MSMAACVLVVEDIAPVAADLEARLIALGYRVTGIAADATEALAEVRSCRPDLVISDIAMHGDMDGIALARVLRDEHALPVIIVSAYSDEATLARAKDASPYGYMLKPFDAQELRVNIEIALQRHRMDRELAQARAEVARLNAQLESRVAQRTADLDEALAGLEAVAQAMAHHLRSPLRAIEGYAAGLGAARGECPRAPQCSASIMREAHRMRHPVSTLFNVLDHGRGVQGRVVGGAIGPDSPDDAAPGA
ncbi:response regulator, partial [Ramlibacter albus]